MLKFSCTASKETISRAVDNALDKADKSTGVESVGISVRNGPVTEAMDIDGPATNGANGKRKSRGSIGNAKSYKEVASGSESEDEVKPAVRRIDRTNFQGQG